MTNKSTKIERLERMKEKYLDQGLDQAADRCQAQIDDLLKPLCNHCLHNPCQCDALYERGMDRRMFPDE